MHNALAFLIRRPVAVTMSFAAAVVLGVVAIYTLPVSLMPEADLPLVSVRVEAGGMDPRTLEEQVVRPLRQQLMQTGGLRDIRSRTRPGSAVIELVFDYGHDTDLAFLEVNEKVDLAMPLLPRGVERPRVVKASITDVPVFLLSVAPRDTIDPLELALFTRSVVQRRLEQLPEVAFADRSGYARPRVRIVPRQPWWAQAGMDASRLEALLAEWSYEPRPVTIADGPFEFVLRTGARVRTVDDLKRLPFRQGTRILHLGDVADIRLLPAPAQGTHLLDGRPAVVFSIRKKADARLFDLVAHFEELLDDLRREYPELRFELTHDQTALLRVSLANLASSLGWGALFAFLVLFAFYRQWRLPLLIGITVPVALVVAFVGFFLAGLSINIISLAGLILGIGLMIDNAIIVMDNIRQQRERGLGLTEACVRGTAEVLPPLLSSALTTCSVFLPLIFLSGVGGVLFFDQGVSIALVLASSFAVAAILLPTLVRRAWRGRHLPKGTSSQDFSGFRQTEEWVLQRPWWLTAGVLVFLASGVWLARHMPRAQFPELTRPGLEWRINWNEPLSRAANEARVRTLLQAAAPALLHSNAFVGTQQFLLEQEPLEQNEARLLLFTRPGVDLDSLRSALATHLQRRYPLARQELQPLRTLFDEVFHTGEPPLVVHLQSVADRQAPDTAAAAPVLALLRRQGVPVRLPARQPLWLLHLREEALLQHEVSREALLAELQRRLGRREVGLLHTGTEDLPVVAGSEGHATLAAVLQGSIANRRGQPVPLARLVAVQPHSQPRLITAGRSGEALELRIERVPPGLPDSIRQVVRRDGRLVASFSGALFERERLLGELSVVLAVALALLYFILAAQFESLALPLVVLFSVPVGMAGALWALWLGGQTLNLVALIGIIVMSGIVVNDAILKVDMMQRLSANMALEQAIQEAGARRLRPIVMTSLTTILALMPVLLSGGLGAELQRPLAWAVTGGLTVGTLASLYWIPVLFRWLARGKRRAREE